MSHYTLYQGDCAQVLKSLAPDSIEAAVTDPPYGLADMSPARVADCLAAWARGETWTPDSGAKGFMGKTWDAWVPGPEMWRELFRVLKPGGHALIFAGSRTQDMMSIALRLAGFEVRDTLMWLYGSGFPKSLDVSKALDKQRHDHAQALEVTAWIRATRDARGLRNADIDSAFGFAWAAGHWTSAAEPRVPTLDHVPKLLDVLGVAPSDLPPRIAYLLRHINTPKGQPGEAWHRREVIGQYNGDMGGLDGERLGQTGGDITAPATDNARTWLGWGTQLKPAYEPVILARKPLDGTIAQNTLTHGCGGLNIDGCRVGEEGGTRRSEQSEYPKKPDGTEDRASGWARTGHAVLDINGGRWPANILLDEHAAEALDAQTGEPVSRFFYTAKASRSQREAGLEGRASRTVNDGRQRDIDNPYLRGETQRKNTHPTVKPLDLMRYLVRLITPPGATCIDPFTGSGSTGCAVMLEGEGRRFVGIEREAEYLDIARARLAHYAPGVEESATESAEESAPEIDADGQYRLF